VTVPTETVTIVVTVTGSPAPSAALAAPPAPAPPQVAARRVHTAEHHPSTPAAAVAVPAAAVDPCPPVAQPVAATARPASSWSHGLDGDGWPRHRNDPAPVAVVSPPSVEHVRSPQRGDDPSPSGEPSAVLATAVSSASSGGRTGADGDLPAGVQPPQLRVLSSRAGPCAGLVPAPHVEILDLPA
jgi:DNA polymerase-3 subunit gamma/tau